MMGRCEIFSAYLLLSFQFYISYSWCLYSNFWVSFQIWVVVVGQNFLPPADVPSGRHVREVWRCFEVLTLLQRQTSSNIEYMFSALWRTPRSRSPAPGGPWTCWSRSSSETWQLYNFPSELWSHLLLAAVVRLVAQGGPVLVQLAVLGWYIDSHRPLTIDIV